MSGPIALLFLLALVALVTGPIALIVSVLALGRIKRLERQQWAGPRSRPVSEPIAEPLEPQQAPKAAPQIVEPAAPKPPVEPAPARPVAETLDRISQPEQGPSAADQGLGLEQRIGTRWVLVAGVVTVIFAVAYFLKYAHDQQWIGPLGRVIAAAIAGFAALGIGEWTRRRGYDIVAKGVTTLGFAILYAAVFAAHRWCHLIDPAPAYVLAIVVTVAAMLYAVALSEIVAAMLALVGGYITPVIISTGQNAPSALFGYVLILSAGAILCAYWRKWPALNVAAFLGTFTLYAGWFERFYRPVMGLAEVPEQLDVALIWLGLFFLVYLILPLLHGLVRRVKSHTSDAVLVLINAAVVFYYLWTMLKADHKAALALCSLGMGGIHLAVAAGVLLRCRDDVNLCQALLAAGLAFVTLAVPLYFRAQGIVMAWTVEGLVLAVIGLRYRQVLVQLAAGLALVLAVVKLLLQSPLHSESFRLFVNVPFGAWCFVALAVLVCHLLYRLDTYLDPAIRRSLVDVLYVAALVLLLAAISQELWYHGSLNVKGPARVLFARYMMPVFPAFLTLCVVGPISPRGKFSLGLAAVLALAGSMFLIVPFSELHSGSFTIFLNLDFFWVAVFVAVLLGAAWLLRRDRQAQAEAFVPPVLLPGIAVLLLWIMLTQEIWCYWRCRDPKVANWELLAHMCISIAWAAYAAVLMVIGFWRGIRLLRYVALAGFVLLLAKVFLIDTRTLESVYRIAGFLATGLTLVGVSYLYQFLKKKGFFDTILHDDHTRR